MTFFLKKIFFFFFTTTTTIYNTASDTTYTVTLTRDGVRACGHLSPTCVRMPRHHPAASRRANRRPSEEDPHRPPLGAAGGWLVESRARPAGTALGIPPRSQYAFPVLANGIASHDPKRRTRRRDGGQETDASQRLTATTLLLSRPAHAVAFTALPTSLAVELIRRTIRSAGRKFTPRTTRSLHKPPSLTRIPSMSPPNLARSRFGGGGPPEIFISASGVSAPPNIALKAAEPVGKYRLLRSNQKNLGKQDLGL
jgi:hypothetical protein